jgi:hypothetical protein
MHYRKQTMDEIQAYACAHGSKLKEYSNTTCSKDILDAVELIKPYHKG